MNIKSMLLVSLILSSYAYTLAASSHELASELYQQLGRQAQERAGIPKEKQVPVYKMGASCTAISYHDFRGIYINQKDTCTLYLKYIIFYEVSRLKDEYYLNSIIQKHSLGSLAISAAWFSTLACCPSYVKLTLAYLATQVAYEKYTNRITKSIKDQQENHRQASISALLGCFTCALEYSKYGRSFITSANLAVIGSLKGRRCVDHKDQHGTGDDAIYKKLCNERYR